MARSDRPGAFEEVVLLAVARLADQGYGVTILREIEDCTNTQPALGAIYATLERLEARGWVSSYQGDASPVRGGRARRHYKLTGAGARALEHTRRIFDRLWDGLALGRRARS
ncbi:MAG: PadR family transcriptional regulator [Vicinamibacteria bacterium]|nr:PadR family transcriptional regulator [Vicinamibacteria bacterium]